jgi:formamidopyrimidine-DNA glycosylase
MPERPDLEYQVPILDSLLRGRPITGVHSGDPVVLRLTVAGGTDVLVGRRIEAVTRLAHTVCLHLDADVDLAISPMLAGRFQLNPTSKKRTKDTVFALDLDRDESVWLRDDVSMARVTTLPFRRWDLIPGMPSVGIDVLSPEFTRDAFRAIAKGRRDGVKTFLRDKGALDALGNAYADEALFAAGVHPNTAVRELALADLDRLHDAIVAVLTEARDTIAFRKPKLDEKLRDFLKVRNRKGEPCPRCGAPIRVTGVKGHDAFFCAHCQPDKKGRGFVDWRKTAG